ncbi:hypothetical protein D0865_03100 [Hortaea werneckii]|uniref:Deacetylase complex subunit Sds3 n=1 Tax=Hortaea werneckii TaxID=91943 RepID=A0A3M7CZR1_HORWE|nr:hypothetical protein D0865_03100 [Hortaea werneckii]
MARPHTPALDQSPSPPPAAAITTQQPMTKRDVRRNRIMERLNQMMDSFSSNQHAHYRAQLQAVQVDMTLVLRADPYESGPLADSGDEVKALIEEVTGGGAGLGGEGGEAAERDFAAMAGKRYKEFAGEVNDCLEKRDAELTSLHDHYHASLRSLESLTQHKLHQASEEHAALSATIRQRLIASLTKKRQNLLRDKEQLDIADSNALLLHPSHFSINNPGSPGGTAQQNRKTRHLRHRAGSPAPGDIGADKGGEGNGGKKKRKAGAMEDENGNGNESPAPPHQPFRLPPPPDALGGGRSPFKDAREKSGYAQFEAPAYSLERIFTEKELAMATATAQHATYRYFHTPQAQKDTATEGQTGSGSNGTAVPSVDGQEGTLPDAAEGQQTNEDGTTGAHPTTENVGTPPPSHPTPVPAAQEMERSTSHQVLTRGTARANPLAALSDLATAAATHSQGGGPSSTLTRDQNPFAPVIPSYHAVSRSDKSFAGAPTPSGVGLVEGENDFEMMRRSGHHHHGLSNGYHAAADPEDLPDADAAAAAAEDAAAAALGGAEMRRQLLDQALGLPSITQPYRLPLIESGPAVIGRGVDRPNWTGFSDVRVYEQQRMRQQISNFGAGGGGKESGAGGSGGGNSGGGAGTGGSGSLAAALQGRITGGGGGEAMSRTTSTGGGSEMGEPSATATTTTSTRRGGRGRLV